MDKKIFLKYSTRMIFAVCITAFLILSSSGCSSRKDEPVALNDSTLVYPSKDQTGIQPKITFSNKISKKTGKPIKPGTIFKLQDNEKLYASIDLEKQTNDWNRYLMFHIDWIDSSGKSFYKKRIDISPSDSSSRITSLITLTPGKRKTGNYLVRVYLFRELIAEKKFWLVDSTTFSKIISDDKNTDAAKVIIKDTVEKILKHEVISDQIKAKIILCKGISKKTGKPIGAGTKFTIKNKAKVKTVLSIEKQDIKTNEQMKFYFDWTGPGGKSFYDKRVVYTTSNPFFTISNSISITPEKRQPGTYSVKVTFRKKVIAEQKFELIAESK
jgi:hypothetical protein